MLGRHLRDEAQTQRRNQQLGHGQEEIDDEHHPVARFGQAGSGHLGRVHGAEGVTGRIVVGDREDDQEEIGQTGNEHTVGNLARGGHRFTPAGKAGENSHHDRGQDNHVKRVQRLRNLGRNLRGIHEVAGEDHQRLAVLVEREPEEDGDAEHGEQSGHTLLDLLGHGMLLFSGVFDALSGDLLARLRELVLGSQEDEQRGQHGDGRDDERPVDTRVEYLHIVGAELSGVGRHGAADDRRLRGLDEFLGSGHGRFSADELMAQSRHVGIVDKAAAAEPPLAEHRGDERGDHAADVDEHIEDLETGVTLVLGDLQSLGALLGFLGFKLVVEFTDQGLQVAFEQTVTEGDTEQGDAGEDQDAPPAAVAVGHHAAHLAEERNGQGHVTGRHDEQTDLDGAVVVLRPVGDQTAHQGQDVNAEIEERVDQAGRSVGQTELRDQEEQQHGIHDVVAEALTHIAESRGNQSLGMFFRLFQIIDDEDRHDDQDQNQQNQRRVAVPQIRQKG